MGRTLEAQRFFHDVNYENRLVDNIIEIYQFNNDLIFHGYHHTDSSSSSSSSISGSIASMPTHHVNSDDEYEEEENDTHQTMLLLPHGVYTELTCCYSPTCNYLFPCYSYTCPNKERLVK